MPISLALQCTLAHLPTPEAEYKFHPTRKWRFDWAFRAPKLAVEVDGGVFVQGRHSRGAGVKKDIEKYAEAMLLGWRVLRVLPEHVSSGQALTWIEKLLNA